MVTSLRAKSIVLDIFFVKETNAGLIHNTAPYECVCFSEAIKQPIKLPSTFER